MRLCATSGRPLDARLTSEPASRALVGSGFVLVRQDRANAGFAGGRHHDRRPRFSQRFGGLYARVGPSRCTEQTFVFTPLANPLVPFGGGVEVARRPIRSACRVGRPAAELTRSTLSAAPPPLPRVGQGHLKGGGVANRPDLDRRTRGARLHEGRRRRPARCGPPPSLVDIDDLVGGAPLVGAQSPTPSKHGCSTRPTARCSGGRWRQPRAPAQGPSQQGSPQQSPSSRPAGSV